MINLLRPQAENCNWDNADEPIRDQVIHNCSSAEIKQLLKGTNLTWKRCKKSLNLLRQ